MFRFVGSLLLLSAMIARSQQPIPIIFDTDIGSDIDDALALALALQSPELDVRAVTTVTDDTVGRSRLAWKELGLYGRHDIPLATGAGETLMGPALTQRVPPQFQVLTAQDVLPPAASRRAADLIVDTLMESRRKLTLVPVGPLTNIALALKMEPRIKDKIERIVLMGGAFGLVWWRPNTAPQRRHGLNADRPAGECPRIPGPPGRAIGSPAPRQMSDDWGC